MEGEGGATNLGAAGVIREGEEGLMREDKVASVVVAVVAAGAAAGGGVDGFLKMLPASEAGLEGGFISLSLVLATRPSGFLAASVTLAIACWGAAGEEDLEPERSASKARCGSEDFEREIMWRASI
jgi:hypothetical protein